MARQVWRGPHWFFEAGTVTAGEASRIVVLQRRGGDGAGGRQGLESLGVCWRGRQAGQGFHRQGSGRERFGSLGKQRIGTSRFGVAVEASLGMCWRGQNGAAVTSWQGRTGVERSGRQSRLGVVGLESHALARFVRRGSDSRDQARHGQAGNGSLGGERLVVAG
jgi:hypothetical protein